MVGEHAVGFCEVESDTSAERHYDGKRGSRQQQGEQWNRILEDKGSDS